MAFHEKITLFSRDVPEMFIRLNDDDCSPKALCFRHIHYTHANQVILIRTKHNSVQLHLRLDAFRERVVFIPSSWSPSVSSRRIRREYPLSECTPPQQPPQNHPPLPLRLVATPLSLCWYFLARVSRQSAWSHVRVLEKLQHSQLLVSFTIDFVLPAR